VKNKNIIPITEARKKIFNIAEEVQKPNTHYTLTERGKPKMVIVSVEEFEALMAGKGKGFLVADGSHDAYAAQRNEILPKVFIIRDESRVVYLSDQDQNSRLKEEGLVKAQLYVALIEKYKYPLHLIEFGRYVKVGGEESRRYIEADILVNDGRGNVRMIFEVGVFSDYDENVDRVVSDLFEMAAAVAWSKKPEFMVYYSRCFKNNNTASEKILTVDCLKFNTFTAWKKAGRPSAKTMPNFY
jgi:prevent-host-death family protein